MAVSDLAAIDGSISQQIASRLGLTANELGIVWLLAAAAVDDQTRQYALALGHGSIDLAVLRSMVCDADIRIAHRVLGPDGELRRMGLIRRADGGPRETHECGWSWGLSPRLLEVLLGTPSAAASAHPAPEVSAWAVDEAARASACAAIRNQGAAIIMRGMPGLGRRSLLWACAQEAGATVMHVDARTLPRVASELRDALREVVLSCRLQDCLPLISNIDAFVGAEAAVLDVVGRELGAIDRPLLMTCGAERPAIKWDRPTIVIEMGQPTTAQRATLWHASLGQGTTDDAELLAERYPLAPALIVRASEAAKAQANGRPLEPDDVYAGIRSVLDDRLGQFAKRVTVTQTWDDLVLPPDQLDTIAELLARVRGRSKVYEQWGFAAKVGRGLGVSALFSGPPGTGKTMVAALIARDLGLELYQVDMGKVVSKFIGETEKNLGALFDAAEAGHAILLFDEADALFGKRTDVKSSNDRYANLETNYLLQRLESFTGICLLTTNHDSHIDPAFQRRLSLHLRFELPDVDERAQLWRATLPAAAPLAGDVDLGALGRRFVMSGGYIRNAALRAAFLAADEDSEITAAHLERAARVEYEGLGKLAA